MISTNWTFICSRAFRQLILCIFTNIISITLPFMAWLTKMSVSPAEPLCYRTAKFTFKLYKIFSMLRTILNGNFTTIRANQIFSIIRTLILSFIHGIRTIFSSSKIGFFTLKTLEISIDSHRILIRFAIVWRFFIS